MDGGLAALLLKHVALAIFGALHVYARQDRYRLTIDGVDERVDAS